MNTPVIVIGAHGVIGRSTLLELHDEGHETISVARRGPVTTPQGDPIGRHLSVDLLSEEQSRAAFAGIMGQVDLVYAAYLERATMRETVEPNLRMLDHALKAVHASGATLRHLVLIGGGKSYGEHLGGYKTPAKESDPRFLGPIFYNNQEDLLAEDAQAHGYGWTVLRPDAVVGFSLGSPMNMLTGIAAYGALCRHANVPLRFPGTHAAWQALHQATDARIVAQATAWALRTSTASGEIFNVTNGDNFRWCHLWPELAQFFNTPVAPPQPVSLKEQMADKASAWDELQGRHHLIAPSLEQFAAWDFVDGWFGMADDMVQSTIKIRRAGFNGCIDTHESFLRNLSQLRRWRFIP